MKLPDAFVDRMKQQLGDEAEYFFLALSQPSPTSIRLNHLKGRSGFKELEQVPWCENGFYLQERPRFHLDPHWHGGAYYVQEASSMILDHVVSQLKLDEQPRIWLDLCAAPGGKTGILAKYLLPSDVLIANEVISSRKNILWENLVKGGYINTILLGEQASAFKEPLADVILIDAPCVGEGMMRKEPEAIRQWSQNLVASCSLLQKQIFSNAIKALKPGGFLIYSTCSFSHEENISNVSYFIQESELESIPISFPEFWGISTLKHKEAIGYQLYPHKVKGEGLFMAVLKNKTSSTFHLPRTKKQNSVFTALPASYDGILNKSKNFKVRINDRDNSLITSEAEQKANEVLERFPRAEIPASAGQEKGKDFIPSHFLAMSGIQHPDYKRVDIGIDDALNYLERSTSIPSFENLNGWYLATYDDTILGWLKHTSQGWKNHYPLNWRLRSKK